ncbi:hypothetical protein SLS59_007075 [Nothophoma quercina]|uniref:Uncharacterized protein n=1 Tax=Nothophoma quercina TaxID=749835 RepID=A0ABR3R0Z7_9PLEO
MNIASQSNEGYRKIRFCAQRAKRDGLNYFWIDTCCINQSSSTELHEAINSMFRWYQNARKCYVFLSDVESNVLNGDSKSALMRSRWFTRGWTLQELLAPPSVDFFSREGTRLGDKESLRDIIQDITGIPGDALSGRQLPDFTTADRFSWAAHRRTTRPEDGAYCLLGIFDIHFPLIYGEGKEKALKRLRKEIRESVEGFANVSGDNANTRTRSHQEKLSKIYNSLSAPDPTTNYREARKRRQAGTGLWLLESRKFKKWKGGAASPLWLYGIPGCGKTILSSTVIKNLLQHCHDDPGMVLAYFYFDFNDAQKRDPELMVRSLFCQLMQRSVAYPEAIDALYSSCEDGRTPSLDALLEAIQQVTQQLTHVYIVIDALDECTLRTDLMNSLTAVIGWRLDSVHLLMTSRKERDIESSLETCLSEKDLICLQRDAVDNDIQRYVRERLSGDRKLATWNKDPIIGREIEAAMRDGARGMFRWAACQLDTFTTCRNRAMLRESLATLPQTLDLTYDRILLAISKQDRKYAMRILQWLAFSARPLSVEEVAEAAAIDLARSPAFDRDEVLEDPLDALSICSSLVTITTSEEAGSRNSRKIIALAHYSVHEYLVSGRIKQGQAQHYGMQEVECHTAITKGSIEYLNQFQHPLSSGDLETSALARYAAEFWSDHFRKANEPSKGISRLVPSLFSEESPAYHAWIQLYDPDNPWMGPDLEQSLKHVATPLYYAALLGLSTITQLLLEQGAQADAEGGRWGNALQAASYGGHELVVKILLDNKANVNALGGPHGSALNAAVAEDNEAVVKILLAGGANVKGVDVQLKSVIHHAVNSAGCKPSLVILLLDRGAPPNTLDVNNMTPLHYSVKLGHKSVAGTLLARGCSIDVGIQRKIWHRKTIEQHTVYEEFPSEPLP